MSSILKALQKLEKETSRELDGTALPRKIDTRETIHRRVRDTWMRNRLVPSLLFAGILITGIWLGFRMFPAETSQAPATLPADVMTDEPPAHSRRIAAHNSEQTEPSVPHVPPPAVRKSAPKPEQPSVTPPPEKTDDPVSPKRGKAIFPVAEPADRRQVAVNPFRSPALQDRMEAKPETKAPAKQAKAKTGTRAEQNIRNRTEPTAPPLEPAVTVPAQPPRPAPEVNPAPPPQPDRRVLARHVAPPPPEAKPEPALEPPAASSERVPGSIAMEVNEESYISPKPSGETDRNRDTAPANAIRSGNSGAGSTSSAADSTQDFLAYQSTPEKSSRDLGLDIQALVWAPDPRGRMAMINGNIIRTGEIVNENAVTFIGEDFIIVRNGGDEWKVKFYVR